MQKMLPLNDWHRARGATMNEEQGWLLPRRFSQGELEYEAVRQHAGLFDLSHRSLLRFTGSDRIRFLQGMTSNDVESTATGEGIYAALLDVQGKILADLRLFIQKDAILVDCWEFVKERLLAHLNRYLIADEVEIEDLTEEFRILSLQGPRAPHVLREIATGLELPARHLSHTRITSEGTDIWVIHADHSGEGGVDLFLPAGKLEHFAGRLEAIGKKFSIRWVGTEVQEVVRLEAGIPRYGIDMDEDTILLETGLKHAVSFDKGCYLGQEIIERIRSRGHVNRMLVGMLLQGTQPAPRGEKIFSGDKEIGKVTSSVYSPAMRTPIALGYVRTEYGKPDTGLELRGGTGAIPAIVTTLPFKGTFQPLHVAGR